MLFNYMVFVQNIFNSYQGARYTPPNTLVS